MTPCGRIFQDKRRDNNVARKCVLEQGHAGDHDDRLTGENISDGQIRELRASAVERNRWSAPIETQREMRGLIETCDLALGETKIQVRDGVREYARVKCVAIISARMKEHK